jgi:hypothetical protein
LTPEALTKHGAQHNKQTPMSSTIKRTPPRVSFSSITPNNIGTLRKINLVVFPVKYSEKFYKDVLLPEAEEFCKLGVPRSR